MNDSKPIPGFLPEDYDKEPPGIEEQELDEQQLYWLHHDQKENEDGIALGERMSAEYDAYITIGFKKEKHTDDGPIDHESVTGACRVNLGDYDAVSEISKLLGYYAFKNPEVSKILLRAISWRNDLQNAEDNPEPPEHDYLPREQRFHLNRYNRILTEEYDKVRDKFISALGNSQLRHDMRMKMVLTAIADQLNENEAVETDFFCNFVLSDRTDGDNVSGIDVRRLPYPCSWQEAEISRDHFVELCKKYNVPCHIVWLED